VAKFCSKTVSATQWPIIDDDSTADAAPTAIEINYVSHTARRAIETLGDGSKVCIVCREYRVAESFLHELGNWLILPAEVRGKLDDSLINADNTWYRDPDRDNSKIVQHLSKRISDDF
jgi:hypothetical protein